MRVEGQLVDLAVVLVQLGQLDAGAVEIVQHNLAIGGRGGDVGAVAAMRPLDIVDLEGVAVPGWRGGGAGLVVRGIVDDGGAQVGLLGALGASDADGLEDLAASEDGMCPLLIDVDGADVKAGLVACILRRQRAQPGGGQQRLGGSASHNADAPGDSGLERRALAVGAGLRLAGRARAVAGEGLLDKSGEGVARLLALGRQRGRRRRVGRHGVRGDGDGETLAGPRDARGQRVPASRPSIARALR